MIPIAHVAAHRRSSRLWRQLARTSASLDFSASSDVTRRRHINDAHQNEQVSDRPIGQPTASRRLSMTRSTSERTRYTKNTIVTRQRVSSSVFECGGGEDDAHKRDDQKFEHLITTLDSHDISMVKNGLVDINKQWSLSINRQLQQQQLMQWPRSCLRTRSRSRRRTTRRRRARATTHDHANVGNVTRALFFVSF